MTVQKTAGRVADRLRGHGDASIGAIVVGDRLRQDLGDIYALATSIQTYGLLHPIVIDKDGNLVAGQRRLEACRILKWTRIPVRRYEELSDEEREAVEREENVQRKALSAVEMARRNVAKVEAAKKVAAEHAKRNGSLSRSGTNPKGGRPRKDPAASVRDIEKRTGVPKAEQHRATQIVATASELPIVGSASWTQRDILHARKLIDDVPEKERPAMLSFINEQGQGSPQTVLPTLRNLSEMDTAGRDRIAKLWKSNDSRERDLAITDAAKNAPMADPRIHVLLDAIKLVRKSQRLFPNDPHNDAHRIPIAAINDLIVAICPSRAQWGNPE